MDAKSTGAKIAAMRKEKGWSQKELAAQLHVTDKAVSKWERGLNYPDLSLLEPISELFEISLLELLGMEQMPIETAVQELAQISQEEKAKLKREFRNRAWLNFVLGLVIWITQIWASYLFDQAGMYGLPHILTLGMTGATALVIANALHYLINYRKLQ